MIERVYDFMYDNAYLIVGIALALFVGVIVLLAWGSLVFLVYLGGLGNGYVIHRLKVGQ